MPTLKSAADYLSGYLSGLISCTVCAPLDITRTRLNLKGTINSELGGFFETLKTIYVNKGYRGYYDGFSATLVGVPLFQFLYFGFYYKLKEDLPYKNLIFRDMLASMLSGGVCQVITNPIWVIRIRMQSAMLHHENMEEVKQFRTIASSFRAILKEEGVQGLYKGTLTSLMGKLIYRISTLMMIGVSHVCINMPTYDYLIRKLNKDPEAQPSKTHVLIASNTAKSKTNPVEVFQQCLALACVLTYPHVVIRSRQQDFRHLSAQKQYYQVCSSSPLLSLRSVVRGTWAKEGFRGFYGGLAPDLVKVLPANMILMLFFEYFRNKFGSNHHQSSSTSKITLILGQSIYEISNILRRS